MKLSGLKALNIALITLLGSMLFIVPVVRAQTSSAKVSPVKTIVSINPGGKQQMTIAVENSGAEAAKFNALFDNFTVSDEETGEPKIIDDPTFAYGIKTWLSGPSSISLASGARGDYALTVTVPTGTKPGTYYGVVRFGVGGTNTSVGSLFFINVGAITQQVSIEELDTTGIHVDNLGQATGKFAVRLKNTGNGYTVPSVLIEVLNDQKKVIETIDANKGAGGILPNGSIRKYSADFSNSLDPHKTYSARVVTVTAGSNKPVTLEKNFLEASASPATASKTTPPKAKKSNIIPIAAGAAIIAVLTVIAGILLVKKRRKLTTMPVPAPQKPLGPPLTSLMQPDITQPASPPVSTTPVSPPPVEPNDDTPSKPL